MRLFLQKNAKFSSAGGSAPTPPCLQRLGALPSNPQPPAAGSFAQTAPPPLRISGYAPEHAYNNASYVLSLGPYFISSANFRPTDVSDTIIHRLTLQRLISVFRQFLLPNQQFVGTLANNFCNMINIDLEMTNL